LRTLRRALEREGIEFTTPEARAYDDVPDYGQMLEVAAMDSPRLVSFVGLTNTDSNNLYAERILRALAAELFPGEGPVHPILRSRAPDAFLTRAGIDPQSFTVADGSGLSRANRLTPIGTVALLHWMWDHPDPATQRAFYTSLPIGGQSGTLQRRYASGDARGNVRAKTGYIRRVRTLSGFVAAANGRTIVFSLMCNGYSVRTRRVNRAQDAVVELFADYAGRPQPPVRRGVITGSFESAETP
jgi:D-alanyl-D-alanine carboxypeptidase/D-alanyl-D-alanine-endopeptidase (penicillin-binding protein 4)